MHDIKQRFPIFASRPELVYLDSAATSLKPTEVIDAVSEYYRTLSANVGRGLYATAEETTARYEATREQVARFVSAETREIIFTRSTTESLNLLADTLEDRISEGDNIVVTELEHHSNFLPWKRLADRREAELRIVPFDDEGHIDPDAVRRYVNDRTKVLALSAVSNVLGSENDIATLVRTSKEANPESLVIVDAAQAAGHMPVDVRGWGADFVAFSGHKCFGPTGVGALFGRYELLESLPPYQVGGGMVLDACVANPTYTRAPHRFEAGTPDIAAVLGLHAAIDFIGSIGVDQVHEHEIALATRAVTWLREAFGDSVRILGPTDERESGIVSFMLDDIHPHDIAAILGERDICIRAGEHCAAPLHRALDLPATARASFSVYNTEEDIDHLIEGLIKAKEIFD